MAYIGTEPKDIRSFGRAKFDYTASQGQTAFTGADDDGKTLGFTDGQMEVFVNGILMDESDFSTSNGNTVTLASAANLNDIISIVAMQTDIPNSDYVPASGGTFTGAVTNSGNVTVGGTLGVTGATTLTGNTTVGGTFGSTGLITASGGVAIGGTGAANTLDDYEYGTFTPTYSTTNNDASGVTYTTYNKGTYVKVGNVVHFQLNLSINAMTSNGTGVPKIGGLPFNTSSSAPLNQATRYTFSTYSVDYVTSSTAGYMYHAYFPSGGVNYLHFLLTQDGWSWGILNTSQFTLGAGHYVTFQGVYFAD